MKIYRGSGRIVVQFLLLALIVSKALGQEAGIQLRAQFGSATQSVVPGENMTLVVTITNDSSEQLMAESEISLPEGWSLVIPPGQVLLPPGARQVIPFVVQTGRGTPPGEHEVVLRFAPVGEGAESPVVARHTVEVATVVDLAVEVMNAPRIVVAQSFTFQASVRNNGNTSTAVRAEATSSLNASVAVTPRNFSLRPGEIRRLELQVNDLSQLNRAQRQYITISLYHQGAQDDALAQELVTVERVPAVLPETSAYRLYPVDITVQGSGNQQRFRDFRGDFAVVLTGAGAVSEDESDRLSFRVSDELLSRNSRNYVRYSRGTFQATLGDVRFTPASFARTIRGTGFTVAADMDVPGFDRVRTRFVGVHGDGLQVSAALDASLSEQLTVRPFFTLQPGDATFGIDSRVEIEDDEGVQLSLSPRLAGANGDGLQGLRLAAGLEAQVEWSGNRIRVSSHYSDSHWTSNVGAARENSFQAVLKLDQLLNQPPFTQFAVPETRLELSYGTSHMQIDDEPLVVDRSFGVSVNSILTWGTVDLQFERHIGSEDQAYRFLGVVSDVQLGPFTVTARLEWSESTAQSPFPEEREPVEAWGIQLSSTTALAGGDFGSRITAQLFPHRAEQNRLTLLALWEGPISPQLQLELGTEYRSRGTQLLDSRAGLDVSMGDGSNLDLGAGLRLFRGREPALMFSASYTYPIDIRLGKRSDIGAVFGRVTGPGGEPMQDLIVTMGGNSTSTDAEGNYRFPAIEAGERYLQVMPGQLPANWSVAPANLIRVEVVAGESHRVDMSTAPTAQVYGRFVRRSIEDPDQDVILGLAGASANEGAIAGIRVEARMGEKVRTVTSDANGAFTFDMLPQGEWQLSISAPELEGYYRIEPSALQLELAPGEEREIEIEVIPVPRRLQIFDGGTIEVP